MGESFAADAESMGYPADWDGDHDRNDDHHAYTSPLEKIVSEESISWLTETLKNNIFQKHWDDVVFRRQHYGSDDFIFPIELLEGSEADIPESAYLVEYNYIIFHLRDFIEALRHARVPVEVQIPFPAMLIWDSKTQKPQFLPVCWHGDSNTSEFIRRSWTTSDHGRKLLLASKSEFNADQNSATLSTALPEFISKNSLEHYQLLYHTRQGVVTSIELTEFFRREQPVVTRTGIYFYDQSGYESIFSDCYLRANAMLILAECAPTAVELYVQKTSCTVFEVGLERLALPKQERRWESLDSAIFFFKKLETKFANQTVLLTNGGHPCDIVEPEDQTFKLRHKTTTVRHYRQALEMAKGHFDKWTSVSNLRK